MPRAPSAFSAAASTSAWSRTTSRSLVAHASTDVVASSSRLVTPACHAATPSTSKQHQHTARLERRRDDDDVCDLSIIDEQQQRARDLVYTTFPMTLALGQLEANGGPAALDHFGPVGVGNGAERDEIDLGIS